MTRFLRVLGSRCAAHPVIVVTVWLGVAAATTVASYLAGGHYSVLSTLPGTEVQRADQDLSRHLPAVADESADVLLRAASPQAVQAAVPTVAARIARLPQVAAAPAGTVRYARGGTVAWVPVRYDAPRFTIGHRALRDLLRVSGSVHGVEGFVTGSLSRDAAVTGGSLGEEVGISAAIIVLLIAFGSVIAALMPLATAAVAIVTGLALVRLLALVYSVNDSAPQLASMMGLGVGVDYALFIVTRHREGLRAHLSPRVAAAAATATAGSSVLWAGVTVVAAICGLVFGGIPVMSSMGFAAAIVVACSVAAALTLLPALLSLTGRRIDALHVPLPHLRHERVSERLDPSADNVKGEPPPTWWTRWAQAIERRPVRHVVWPTLLLLLLAVPVAGMRLGAPDEGSAAHSSEAYRAFTLMSRSFGVGANAPLILVAELPNRAAAAATAAAVRTVVAGDRGVAAVSPFTLSPDGRIGVVRVQARSGPQDAATQSLVRRLRGRVLPPVRRLTGARVLVTGTAAGRYDIGHRVLTRLPWFVGAVLAVSFLLLMLVFRSLLVPLKAVLLNLLSIAAALGVTIAVFTWGWLRQLVGVAEPVPLEAVVPMLMFAVVFGLSMDYEVFLLSRVREEWATGGDSRGSVVRGLTATARVISAAAGIMVTVFLAFTLTSDVTVKMIGFGLAISVFLDATLIRLVLVPATMSLLGDLNWWLPRRLDRLLPHIDVEAAVPVTPPYQRQETEAPIPRPTP